MTKLYAVFGGHLPDPTTSGPEDIVKPELISLHLDQPDARHAWSSASQASVDDAHRRYFEVCLDMDVLPRDVPPLEQHVGRMIFSIGTEAHLMQLIAASVLAMAILQPAEERLVEEIFAPDGEASLSRWASAAMTDPAPSTYRLERICALGRGVLRPMVYLRDHEGLRLTPEVLADTMSLTASTNLLTPNGDPVVPAALLEDLSRYFDRLPGFRDTVDSGYLPHTRDQHSHTEMMITMALYRFFSIDAEGETT